MCLQKNSKGTKILVGFKIPSAERMLHLLKIHYSLAKLFIKIFWSELWGHLWYPEVDALSSLWFCRQRKLKFRWRRQFPKTQSELAAETLDQTFDVTNCSFRCTEVSIFNHEIIFIIYFNPPSRGIPTAQSLWGTHPASTPADREVWFHLSR